MPGSVLAPWLGAPPGLFPSPGVSIPRRRYTETEDAESGVNGNPFTTSSGIIDGGSGAATVTYSSAAAHTGSLGIRFASVSSIAQRQIDHPQLVDFYCFAGFSFKVDAAPTAAYNIALLKDLPNSTNRVIVRHDVANTISIRDGATPRATSASPLSLGTQYYIAFGFQSGLVVMRIYDGSGNLIEDESTLKGAYSGGQVNQTIFGVISNPSATLNADFDNITYDTGGWPTPPVAGNVSLNGTMTDSITGLSDSISRVLALPRALADSAPATDALARSLALPRSVSDSAPATDGLARSLALPRALADSAAATDALTRSLALPRSISDSAPATDVMAGAPSQGRSCTDSAPGTDALTRTLVLSRALGDTGTASDTLARVLALPRALSDSGTATDAIVRVLALPRSLADSAPASDVLARSTARSRSLSDSAPAVDALGRSLSLLRVLADLAPATDTAAGVLVSVGGGAVAGWGSARVLPSDAAHTLRPGDGSLAIRDGTPSSAVLPGQDSTVTLVPVGATRVDPGGSTEQVAMVYSGSARVTPAVSSSSIT